MRTSEAFSRIYEQRVIPAFFDLERLINRVGYLRVVGTLILSLGAVGTLGLVLGLEWLRATYGSLAGLAVLTLSAIAFSTAKSLRERISRSEQLVRKYALALGDQSGFYIKRWQEDVLVEKNGDARIRRQVVIAKGESDSRPPHFITMNLSYYGKSELTPRDKRRVAASAHHASSEDTSEGVRADATSSWTTTGRHPRLDIIVHLGDSVRDGDTISVYWDWPRFSRDLMLGKSTEDFDVVFGQSVESVHYRAVFQGAGRAQGLAIRPHCAPTVMKTEVVGDDFVVTFELDRPERKRPYGFTADRGISR